MLLLLLLFSGAQATGLAGAGEGIPRAYFQSETEKLAGACLTALGSREEWIGRQEEHRRQLLEMLGLWPMPERSDLRTEVTGRLDMGDFEVERLHYQSLPGLYVTANLYLPKGMEQPAPAILYVCGHGAAIKDGVSYGNKVSYHHHGVWFARQGYVCLMIDTLQLGEIQGLHHGTYRLGEWWWNSRGYTPAGVETWNGIRALDYLETRPEVDATRIGMTGRSGGGAYTWFVSAVDERVRVAAPVAGITDLENHVVDGTVAGHCDCMFVVNTYRWDYPQVAALVAPRPLLIANSDKDTIFPLEGVVRLHRKVKGVYDLLGAGTNLGLLITEGPHQDTQDLQLPVFRWFNRFLKSDEGVIERAAVKVLSPDQLKVFEEMPGDAINAQIQETFVGAAAAPDMSGSAAEWLKMREGWLRALRALTFAGWPSDADRVEVHRAFEVVRQGVRLEAYDFVSQPGVDLQIVVARRNRVKRPVAVELTVLGEREWERWAAGMSYAFAEEMAEIAGLSLPRSNVPASEEFGQSDASWFDGLQERLAREDRAVAWLAPRGVGRTAWSGDERERTQIRRRFMLLGQTLDGMRVWDIRRGLAALQSIEPFRKSKLELRGKSEMGMNALLAAVFEDGLDRIEVEGIPVTFREGPDYLNILRIIEVPQAVVMAAEHCRVHVASAAVGDWSFVNVAADRLGWERGRVTIEAP